MRQAELKKEKDWTSECLFVRWWLCYSEHKKGSIIWWWGGWWSRNQYQYQTRTANFCWDDPDHKDSTEGGPWLTRIAVASRLGHRCCIVRHTDRYIFIHIQQPQHRTYYYYYCYYTTTNRKETYKTYRINEGCEEEATTTNQRKQLVYYEGDETFVYFMTRKTNRWL